MNKSIAILGMGRFGQFLAEELSKNGADVLIADNDEKIVNQYSGIVSDAVIADLTDTRSIKNIGLSGMDLVIVTMGSSLEASILCVMVAKECGVPRVIAKAASDRMGEILRLVGADEIIYPEKESALQNAHKILSANFLEYFSLDEDLCIINMRPKAEWIGKSLSELRLRNRYGINVVAIREKDGSLSARIDPEKPLTEDAQILVLSETKELKRLKD